VNIPALPFNALLGLEPAKPASGFLVSLPADPKYTNHLGTVHAAALFAVAEAGSGVFLLNAFGSAAGFVPVVRRVETKYRYPATGRVSARAAVATEEVERWKVDLASRGRLSATVMMEVVDDSGRVVMTAAVEWFVTRA
jgi:acyl-coenzyme A thioesterase PaaI-like protein